jgi:SAM-dependent methyltransferase
VLEAMPHRSGLALDNSKFAARKAAKCHPRAGAVVADIWDELPVMTGSAAAAINVFSPRNGIEIHRILATGGRLVVVTPGPDHLQELIGPFGMISVDSSKQERLEEESGEAFEMEELPRRGSDPVADGTGPRSRRDLVSMGPSAGRLGQEELDAAIAGLEGRLRSRHR